MLPFSLGRAEIPTFPKVFQFKLFFYSVVPILGNQVTRDILLSEGLPGALQILSIWSIQSQEWHFQKESISPAERHLNMDFTVIQSQMSAYSPKGTPLE